jgi:hypothetical protein
MEKIKNHFNPRKTDKDPVYERSIVMISSKSTYIRKVIPGALGSILSFDLTFGFLFNTSEYLPPFIEISEARKSLKFPVGHPIDGGIYCTSEMDSKRYVPISSFHSDMYNNKLSFFMDMCSILGVKECTMTEMCKNGQTFKFDVGASGKDNINDNDNELKGGTEKNDLLKMEGNFSFPKPKHQIKRIDSKWLNSEQTWDKMQDIRIERDMTSYKIEFNIDNDFGINLNTIAKFRGDKLKFGGQFKEFTISSYTYKINFWEK